MFPFEAASRRERRRDRGARRPSRFLRSRVRLKDGRDSALDMARPDLTRASGMLPAYPAPLSAPPAGPGAASSRTGRKRPRDHDSEQAEGTLRTRSAMSGPVGDRDDTAKPSDRSAQCFPTSLALVCTATGTGTQSHSETIVHRCAASREGVLRRRPRPPPPNGAYSMVDRTSVPEAVTPCIAPCPLIPWTPTRTHCLQRRLMGHRPRKGCRGCRAQAAAWSGCGTGRRSSPSMCSKSAGLHV